MLSQATFVGFAITAQPEAARAFYADVLGLTLLEETDFALVFDAHGAPLRLLELLYGPRQLSRLFCRQLTILHHIKCAQSG